MTRLCLITALPAETRPLLDALKLKQVQAGPLRAFANDTILLLETGTGKLNAAAGTAAILQHYPNITGLMNIGIAGGNFNYSQLLLAHHVKDQGSGAQWYPHIPGHSAFRGVSTASIRTVDKPDTQYKTGVLYDMEAAGVFCAATRYLSTSQIFSIKVVSDNPEHKLECINKARVKELIRDAIPTIRPMIDAVLSIDTGHDQVADVENYINMVCQYIQHSVNDKQQLRRLTQRHLAITGTLPTTQTTAGTARSLRHRLSACIDSQAIVYGDQ